jgi:hypothetical protein
MPTPLTSRFLAHALTAFRDLHSFRMRDRIRSNSNSATIANTLNNNPLQVGWIMDRPAEAELDVSLRELAEDAAMTLTSRARQALLCDAPLDGRPTDHRYPAAHPLSCTDSPGTRSREAIRFRVLHTFPLESGSRGGL